MINSLDIINLPHNWKEGKGLWIKVGDRITLDGKHLLLVGDNGVGKTTFLQALRDSLDINRSFKSGWNSLWDSWNPYNEFTQIFNWESWKFTGDNNWNDEEYNEMQDEELILAISNIFQKYLGYNLVNLWLKTSAVETSKWHFSSFVNEYIKRAEEEQLAIIDKTNVFFLAEEKFVEWLELYAIEQKVPPEKIFGATMLMMQWIFHRTRFDVTEWWYIVPKAKKMQSVYSASVTTLLDWWLENKKQQSLGERTLEAVNTVLTKWWIAILDEPTNGLSMDKAKTIREELMAIQPWKTQIFAASHSEALVGEAFNNPNWHILQLKHWNK